MRDKTKFNKAGYPDKVPAFFQLSIFPQEDKQRYTWEMLMEDTEAVYQKQHNAVPTTDKRER